MGQPFGHLFRLLLLTGCRRDEIADLTWAEVADDLSSIHLGPNRTKNGRSHNVALSPLAQEVLGSVRRIEGCPYVFSTTGRTPVSGFSKAKTTLDAIMLRLAREERGEIDEWRLHDLRRTAATGMAGIGVAPHIVEAALNHVSGAKAGVAGTYNVEAYAVERKEALERWAAHVQRVVSGNVVELRRA
jgi:integrase